MFLTTFLFYAAVFDFVFGGYIVVKNPKSQKNIWFGILSFGIGLWILGFYLLIVNRTFYWPDKIIDFGGIIIAAGLYVFTKIFPKPNQEYANKSPRLKVLELSPLIILTALLPFNLVIKNANFKNFVPSPVNGPLVGIFVLTLSVYVVLSFKNFYLQFQKSAGYRRQQILYVLLGLLFFLAGALIFDLVLPLFGVSSARLLGPVFSIAFVLPAVIAIVSYRLMDIRLFAGALFANAFGIMVAAILVFWTLLHVQEDRADYEILIPFATVAIFLAVRYCIQKIQRRFFLKYYYNFAKNIEDLNETLRQNLTQKRLILVVSEQLQRALNLKWVSYFDVDAWKIFTVPHQYTDLAARSASTSNLHQFALQLAEPYFVEGPEFEIDQEILTAILPMIDQEKVVGYFLLGPQNSSAGLGSDQIQKITSCWQHIQTAYARSVLHQNLEQRVRQQVENIIEKNRRLREEIQNRLDFVRATTHQLRTPVTALSGALQLLVKEPENGRQKELVDMAYAKSKQLSGVITAILNLARVEQGNIRSTQEQFDLNLVFNNVLAVIRPLAAIKDLKIDYINAGDLEIIGSRQYLEQAFANILENAVQFTPFGEKIKIYFMLEPDFVISCIADSGPGIPAELRPKIFNKNMHNPNSTGLGLGLYLVKTIIDAHPKGHVWFESGESGTTFFVRLKRSIKKSDSK